MKRRLLLLAIVFLSTMLVVPYCFLTFVRIERWEHTRVEYKVGRTTRTDDWRFLYGNRAVQIKFISVEQK